MTGAECREIGEHLARRAVEAAEVELQPGTSLAWEFAHAVNQIPSGDSLLCDDKPEVYLLTGGDGRLIFHVVGSLVTHDGDDKPHARVTIKTRSVEGRWTVDIDSDFGEVEYGWGFRNQWTFRHEGEILAEFRGVRRHERHQEGWYRDAEEMFATSLGAAVGYPLDDPVA